MGAARTPQTCTLFSWDLIYLQVLTAWSRSSLDSGEEEDDAAMEDLADDVTNKLVLDVDNPDVVDEALRDTYQGLPVVRYETPLFFKCRTQPDISLDFVRLSPQTVPSSALSRTRKVLSTSMT